MNLLRSVGIATIALFISNIDWAAFCSAHSLTSSSVQNPKAYLRYDSPAASSQPNFYVEVFMVAPLQPGRRADAIKASLRDIDKKKLLSSSTTESREGGSNFRIPLEEAEPDIIQQLRHYVVFVDVYPTSRGNIDTQIQVELELGLRLEPNAECLSPNLPVSITVTRTSDSEYALSRMNEVRGFLERPDVTSFVSAHVNVSPHPPQSRVVKRLSHARASSDERGPKEMFVCFDLAESPPTGEYELSIDFLVPAPLELRQQQLRKGLEGQTTPDATAEKRDLEDFLDLGLTLTSSVEDVEQEDKTMSRVRTTRGAMDLWFAPILNLRNVKPIGNTGGLVQVFTPFYIDAKVASGKITKETLSLNRINLGSAYEFRHYLNHEAYPNLLRHVLDLRNTSDRDFKQAELKFTYEFQPILGAINQPLGSAPNVLNDEVVPNEDDKFGLEIVPVIGVELGHTYRVSSSGGLDNIDRNVKRFYFGGDMAFDFTKYVRLSISDRFYFRGEAPNDRGRNYFEGTVEAPLAGIGTSRLRAAHTLFFSFERGDQPPFTNPGVNVLKFGYRIRWRGLLINTR